MPLYLVRWPTLDISLIHARDERELLITLDEIGDPSDCRWKVITGPLHLGFRLNLHFEDKTNYKVTPSVPKARISGTEEFFLNGAKFKFLDDETSDSYYQMWDSFVKFCFPELWKLEEKRHEASPESYSPEAKAEAIRAIEAAIMKELAKYFEAGEYWKGVEEVRKLKGQHGNN